MRKNPTVECIAFKKVTNNSRDLCWQQFTKIRRKKCDINEIGSDYALQMNRKFSFSPLHSHSSLSGLFRSLFFTLKLIYDIRLSCYSSSLSSLLCVFLGTLSSLLIRIYVYSFKIAGYLAWILCNVSKTFNKRTRSK